MSSSPRLETSGKVATARLTHPASLKGTGLMHRNAIVWVMGLGVVLCSMRATADVIRTAAGETISGRESKVVDGQIIVPGEEGKPEQKFDLADLEQITFAPGRPSGELKTR